MIPKTIHYCWFGKKPLDEISQKCILSWKTFFPEYEIICWNEDNFDVKQVDFMKEAYDNGKYAFVSDVARLIILYNYGGIYFDTDVEVIKSYSDILLEAPKGFMGYEGTGFVNTGLGYAAEKNDVFLKELISVYRKMNFNQYSNNYSTIACPIIMTNLMKQKGYVPSDSKQLFKEFVVYPSEYFSPLNYETGRLKKTGLTHSIHWYNASWNSLRAKEYHKTEQKLKRLFGKKAGEKVTGIYFFLVRKLSETVFREKNNE